MTFNIGTILFAALFIYMIFTLILYLTSNHFSTYQVLNGPLSRNETYTGLAIRKERVVSSEIGGYINYYTREGTKASANGIVYGISSQPLQSSEIEISSSDLAKVRKQMSSFSYGFQGSNFNSVYSFKSELEGNILQYAGIPSLEGGASAASEAVTLGNQTLCRAPEDGIVLYSRDGYENLQEADITKQSFDQNSYKKTDLKTRKAISAGDDIYSIITSERWSVYIPLTAKQAAQLNDKTFIRVKFLKDGLSQNGNFSIVEIGGDSYGKIDFQNGLIRYASDRFLDIELVTNIQSGLKLPLSSVTTKEFFLIPKEYQTKGGNNNSAGFMVAESSDKESGFINAAIYAEKNGMVYVEKSGFSPGDVLQKPNSNDKFVIGETGNLEGVYCVNEGYARFRRISIIDQNEEYCIVEKGTDYGLSQYDYIIMNADDVNEEDILY